MEKFISMFEGKKTHLSSLGLALTVLAYAMGYLTQEQLIVIAGLFGATGISSLRMAKR